MGSAFRRNRVVRYNRGVANAYAVRDACMTWIADTWNAIPAWVPTVLALADIPLVIGFIIWVLWIKRDSVSAVAWCLAIILLPYFGPFLFFVFGYQHVNRPLRKKKKHRDRYQDPPDPRNYGDFQYPLQPRDGGRTLHEMPLPQSLAHLAMRFGGYPPTTGNRVDFFDDGKLAFDSMIREIEQAKHHIHLEYFIWESDELGFLMLHILTQKAKQGVEVRLLYDAMGSWLLGSRALRPLHLAGGRTASFLSLSLWRRRLQVNMRNHRKIMVVDGRVAYTGGLNVGNEYVNKDPAWKYWRDAHIRVQGPAVVDLQRVFSEDWDFATDEKLSDSEDEKDDRYFQVQPGGGAYTVQVVDSGPDQDPNVFRELVFAAIIRARKRIWIATPYFVPDAGVFDALRLAAFNGLDVRLLLPLHSDKLVAAYAARYLFDDLMTSGIRIYMYRRGMMHSKMLLFDDEVAGIGSSNFDNRSFRLNFEITCMIFTKEAAEHVERALLRDFADSDEMKLDEFRRRSIWGRLVENACRLLSPIL